MCVYVEHVSVQCQSHSGFSFSFSSSLKTKLLSANSIIHELSQLHLSLNLAAFGQLCGACCGKYAMIFVRVQMFLSLLCRGWFKNLCLMGCLPRGFSRFAGWVVYNWKSLSFYLMLIFLFKKMDKLVSVDCFKVA